MDAARKYKWASYIGTSKTMDQFQERLGELKTNFAKKTKANEGAWRPEYLAVKQAAAQLFGTRLGQKVMTAQQTAAIAAPLVMQAMTKQKLAPGNAARLSAIAAGRAANAIVKGTLKKRGGTRRRRQRRGCNTRRI